MTIIPIRIGGRIGGSAVTSDGLPETIPTTITLAQRPIDVDGKEVALLPGMAVTVEIKTGRRRVIDFLLSPLREVASQAGRER